MTISRNSGPTLAVDRTVPTANPASPVSGNVTSAPMPLSRLPFTRPSPSMPPRQNVLQRIKKDLGNWLGIGGSSQLDGSVKPEIEFAAGNGRLIRQALESAHLDWLQSGFSENKKTYIKEKLSFITEAVRRYNVPVNLKAIDQYKNTAKLLVNMLADDSSIGNLEVHAEVGDTFIFMAGKLPPGKLQGLAMDTISEVHGEGADTLTSVAGKSSRYLFQGFPMSANFEFIGSNKENYAALLHLIKQNPDIQKLELSAGNVKPGERTFKEAPLSPMRCIGMHSIISDLKNLQNFALSGYRHWLEDAYPLLSAPEKMQNLTHLNLHLDIPAKFQTTGLTELFTLGKVGDPSLKSNYPRLKSLTLSSSNPIDMYDMSCLLEKFKGLEELDVKYINTDGAFNKNTIAFLAMDVADMSQLPPIKKISFSNKMMPEQQSERDFADNILNIKSKILSLERVDFVCESEFAHTDLDLWACQADKLDLNGIHLFTKFKDDYDDLLAWEKMLENSIQFRLSIEPRLPLSRD